MDRPEFCRLLNLLIEDEKDAGSKQYQDLISTVNVEGDEERMLVAAIESIIKDEKKHESMLRVFKDLICDLKYDL
jgi:rubrerythrin